MTMAARYSPHCTFCGERLTHAYEPHSCITRTTAEMHCGTCGEHLGPIKHTCAADCGTQAYSVKLPELPTGPRNRHERRAAKHKKGK